MKTVLITGSSRGIGKSIALDLAKEDYNIVIHYNSNYEEAKRVEEEINKYNKNTFIIKCNLEDENEINHMVNEITNKYGSIDYLVNNAGIAIDTTFEDKNKENFIKTLNVNLIGPFLLSRIIGNKMYENKFGKIINISSTNGLETYYEESLDYDASKAALISLTHNLSKHYAPYVSVNCICPGWVNTDMNKELDKEFIDDEVSKIYLNRFAEPEEIAHLVKFLLSDEASYINNSIIRIDGGSDHA